MRVSFGEFQISSTQLVSIELVEDTQGHACALLKYAKDAVIILYDDAAQKALLWFMTYKPNEVYQSDRIIPINTYETDTMRNAPKPDNKSVNYHEILTQLTLSNIGTPEDLHKVDVKRVIDNTHYRINVYRWVNARSKLTDSFFVEMTKEGSISSPPMVKKYGASPEDVKDGEVSLV